MNRFVCVITCNIVIYYIYNNTYDRLYNAVLPDATAVYLQRLDELKVYCVCRTPLHFKYGGCNRSQYCNSASRSGRDTCEDVVVVQSTRYGYKPISCSHAVVSSTNVNRVNK